MLHGASLYFHTLRHLTASQIYRRCLYQARRRLGWPIGSFVEPPPDARLDPPPAPDFLAPPEAVRKAVAPAGRFAFFGRAADLGRPVDWTAAGLPLLWRFELHSFRFLAALPPRLGRELCDEWIEGNPVGVGVGWHPFPTSLRLVNWLKSGLQTPRMAASVYRQGGWLAGAVERHLGGNHLLENARALVFAGTWSKGGREADRWRDQGLELLRWQLPIQVLPDGGHFERSPMYHCLMLELVLDVISVLAPGHRDLPQLREVARRMVAFAGALAHPDGRVALFNDSAFGIAPSVAALEARHDELCGRRLPPRSSFPVTGYFVRRTHDSYLAVDAGPVGPDEIPAHAHADIFTFEISRGTNRMIVDSGTFGYTDPAMRSYLRSTAAHNTVEIDGRDQAECWATFRVGRRYPPEDVEVRSEDGLWQLTGTFPGYARLIGDGIRHRRRIRAGESAVTIKDSIEGTGLHRVVTRLHLHPDVELAVDGHTARLSRGEARVEVAATSPLSTEAGWYCCRFGERRRNQVLVLGGTMSLPAELEMILRF